MAITRASGGGFQRLFGLEADTKPTDGIQIGSEFIETDTGASFLFDGSAWFEYSTGGGGGSSSSTTEYTENANSPEAYEAVAITFRDVTGTPDTNAIPSDDKPFPVRQEALVRGLDAVGSSLTPIPFVTASGNVEIGTPDSGFRYRVHKIEVSYVSGAAGTVGVRAGAAGTIIGKRRIPATEGFTLPLVSLGEDYWDVGVDTALFVNASAATVCEGTAWVEEV